MKNTNYPKNLQIDLRKEFYNSEFKESMEKYDINHYSTFLNVRAGIVERVNRTLKQNMWNQYSLQGNYKWVNIRQEIVEKCNSTIHNTIGMKLKDVRKEMRNCC